jgi:hypothetical protein
MANLSPLPPLSAAWVDKNGVPTLIWRQYLISSDAVLRGAAGATFGPLAAAANDAAAAAAGVPVGGLYQTSGTVKIRQV